MNTITKDRRKVGVGTLIAAVFMILILVAGVGVFFFVMGETESYEEALADMHNLDWKRTREDVAILSEPPPIADDKLDITVTNRGSVEARLIWLAVFDPMTDETLLPYTRIDVLVGPQETMSKIGSDIPVSSGHSGSYHIQLISERGSVSNVEYPEPEQLSWRSEAGDIYKHIGYATVHFEAEKFLYNSPTYRNPEGGTQNARPAWVFNGSDTPILFWIELTNHADEPIKLLNISCLEVVYMGGAAKTAKINRWYIVAPTSHFDEGGNLVIQPYYHDEDEIWLNENAGGDFVTGGPPVWIPFGDPGDIPSGMRGQSDFFLILYYEYNGDQLGQIIPFAAAWVE